MAQKPEKPLQAWQAQQVAKKLENEVRTCVFNICLTSAIVRAALASTYMVLFAD